MPCARLATLLLALAATLPAPARADDETPEQAPASGWRVTRTLKVAELDGNLVVTALVPFPSGGHVLLSDNEGNVTRWDPAAGRGIWTRNLTKDKRSVTVEAISPDGSEFVVTEPNNRESTWDLRVFSTADGSVRARIREWSDYFDDGKISGEHMDLRCPGPKDKLPDDAACFMQLSRARYAPDGRLLTVWSNFAATFGLFDRSFKVYGRDRKKLAEWQLVGDRNTGSRAGFNASIPGPVLAVLGDGYVYGDPDGDIRLLDAATLQNGRKNATIAGKKAGPVFHRKKLEENVGADGLQVRGGKLFGFLWESGGYGWWARFNTTTRKPDAPWLSVSSAAKMDVSKSGKWVALGGNGLTVFDADSREAVHEVGRSHDFAFDPAEDDRLYAIYGWEFLVIER